MLKNPISQNLFPLDTKIQLVKFALNVSTITKFGWAPFKVKQNSIIGFQCMDYFKNEWIG